jgi:hypothetical protein
MCFTKCKKLHNLVTYTYEKYWCDTPSLVSLKILLLVEGNLLVKKFCVEKEPLSNIDLRAIMLN